MTPPCFFPLVRHTVKVVHLVDREPAETRRQRVVLTVVWDAQCALERHSRANSRDAPVELFIKFRAGERQEEFLFVGGSCNALVNPCLNTLLKLGSEFRETENEFVVMEFNHGGWGLMV